MGMEVGRAYMGKCSWCWVVFWVYICSQSRLLHRHSLGVCDQKRGFKEGYLWLGLDSGQLQQQVIKNKCCQIKTLKTVVSQLPKKQQNPRGWFFIEQ